jgi:cytochrome c oxidase subunit 3
MSKHYHPFHLVDPSPWPYVGAFSALGLATGGVLYMHSYAFGDLLLFGSLTLVILVMIVWWRDVIREATMLGEHTLIVQRGLRYGMLLFIISEVCFFFSFFWAFFHSSLGPAVDIGSVWPPIGITPLNAFDVPLLNTAILLTSGATVTWSHHAIVGGHRYQTILSLFVTIVLGVIFSGLQAMEYYEAPFTIADSVYGSTFYVATGFHGLHGAPSNLYYASI